jgi:hypothetical protein
MIVLLCARSPLTSSKNFTYLVISTSCSSVFRPQFYEIYKHGAVLGISLTFMAVDCLGGVFSILSLIFKRHVDVLAAVAYALVVVRPPIAQINIV